ncbi:hypothetical protein B0H11DRAFT_2259836 [Mycena galericulata]|nr:hypothetical protein B0H11DRAFT_2259836 [Mycena galericulata]
MPPPPVPSSSSLGHQMFEQFTDLAGFKSVDLPPPPPGYKLPAPADPPASAQSLTTIDNDNDEDVVPFDADAPTEASPSGTPNAGRTTTKQRSVLDAAYQRFVRLVANTAAETGLSETRVVKSFIKDVGTQDQRAQNRWNAYLKYAHARCNVVEERRRIDPTFTLNNDEDVPTWSMTDLAAAFQAFKTEYGDTAGDVLDVYRSLSRKEEEQTMGARQRLFAATVRKLQHTFKTLETLHDVHGLFLLVGTRVHEDAEFAEFATTGVLDQLLPRLKLKPNELLGLAKVLAYNVKVSSLEATVADDDTAPSVSAPPKASRPRKTKVIRKNMTHLTQEQKDELAKAAKVARAVEALRRVKNIRDELSRISEADIKVDLWRDLPPRNGFAWKVVPQLLAQNNLRVVGFPHYVRPPPHFPGTKGIGGLHLKEMDALEDAIAAREGSSVYGGLRIECYKYK